MLTDARLSEEQEGRTQFPVLPPGSIPYGYEPFERLMDTCRFESCLPDVTYEMFDPLLVKYIKQGNAIVGLDVIEAGDTVIVSADLIHMIDTPWIDINVPERTMRIIDINGTIYNYKFELFDAEDNLYLLKKF